MPLNPTITARHVRNEGCRAVLEDPVSLGDANAPAVVVQNDKLRRVNVTRMCAVLMSELLM
jgi:hypothetical protein